MKQIEFKSMLKNGFVTETNKNVSNKTTTTKIKEHRTHNIMIHVYNGLCLCILEIGLQGPIIHVLYTKSHTHTPKMLLSHSFSHSVFGVCLFGVLGRLQCGGHSNRIPNGEWQLTVIHVHTVPLNPYAARINRVKSHAHNV